MRVGTRGHPPGLDPPRSPPAHWCGGKPRTSNQSKSQVVGIISCGMLAHSPVKENGWWRSVLEWVDKNEVDPLLILDNTVVENFTPADVLRAAAWFDRSNYARFVMLPEASQSEQ